MEEKWFPPVTTTESNKIGLHQPGNKQRYGNYRSYVICNNTCSNSSIGSELNNSDGVLSSQSCKSFTNPRTAPSTGVNLRVTGQCSQGGRKYMEDFFTVAYQQSKNSKDLEYAFIGIFDGHGGAEAATFAKEHLMLEIINQKLFWSDLDQDVLHAIREGYIATHYAMWRQQDKWPKTGNGLPSTAGTTATVAFIRHEKLFIGHVGDSGIALGYQNDNEDFWRAKQLTVDHKPEVPEERTRILKSGGKVIVKSGVPRVVWNRPRNVNHRGPILKETAVDEIPFLAVARSLGDLWSYNSERDEFVVSPDPDVKVIPIDPHTFRCLIFGTDGLWNVISPQEAVNTVRDNELSNESANNSKDMYWINPSKILVEQALQKWSAKKMRADNTSVVTVILYPSGKAELITANYNSKNKCRTSMSYEPVRCELECGKPNIEVALYNDVSDVTSPEVYRNYDYFGDNDKSFEMSSHCISDEHNYNGVINGRNCDMVSSVNVDNKIINSTDEGKAYCESDRKMSIQGYNKYVQHLNIDEKYVSNFVDSYSTPLYYEHTQQISNKVDCNSSWIISSDSNRDSLEDRPESKYSSYKVKVKAIVPTNMQDIIEEQQLYQQQCMNEEDGYSLTKLETRQEQQTLNVQNVSNNSKVIEKPNLMKSEIGDVKLYQASTNCIFMQQVATKRLLYHQDLGISQMIPRLKPLEFQSLLQQDREEEKQMVFERQQVQSGVTSIGLVNQQQSQSNFEGLVKLSNEISKQTFIESTKEKQAVEKYLLQDKVIEQVPMDKLIAENVNQRQELCDATVQKQEVSSISFHNEDPLEEVTDELIMNKGKETTTIGLCNMLRPLKGDCVSPKTSLSARNARPITLVNIRRTNNRILCNSTTGSTNLVHNSNITSVNNYIKSRTRSRCHIYSNIQHENLQRDTRHSFKQNVINNQVTKPRKCSDPAITCTKTQRGRHFKREYVNKNSNNIHLTHSMKRKLRSTNSTNGINNNNLSLTGFYKNTLRPRIPITKDMKTKSNLITTGNTFPKNVTPRHYMENITSRSKTSGDSLLHNEPKCISTCKAIKKLQNDKKRAPGKTSLKVKLKETLINERSLEQNPIYTINLRSRARPPSYFHNVVNNNNARYLDPVISAAPQLQSFITTPTRPNTNLTPKMFTNNKPMQHTMHTRSSSKLQSVRTPSSSIPLIVGAFSKSTRTQNGSSSLAPPPPSPKLINAIAAVAAATRARTLLTSKQAANNTQSVMKAVFGKRSSLRSNVSCTSLSFAAANPPTALSIVSKLPCNNKLLKQSSQTLKGRNIKRLKR